MVRCIDCVKLEKCAKTSGKPQIVEIVPGCEDGKRKPITNGDRMRGMTDEELAMFIRDQIIDRNIGIPSETWLEWLKQETFTWLD